MNAIAFYTQGGSGAMVEYLLHNLKVEYAPTVCSNTLPLHRRKIPEAQRTQQKIQAQFPEFFLALCTN
jgi:hypothetical protein